MSDIQVVLSEIEVSRLKELEETIQHGLDTFFEVGEALAEVRDKQLWRGEYTSFEEYCNWRWNFTKRRANQLISASAIVESLGTTVPEILPPANEAQARPLQQLAPDRRAEAWTLAVTSAPGGNVTSDHVKSVVDQMLGKTGRFAKKLYYPVYAHEHVVYDAATEQSGDLYNDGRFNGMEFLTGDVLNSNKKYEAFSLVPAPDIDVPDFAASIPDGTKYGDYPVDRAAKIIYLDRRERNKPKNLYAGCQWISAWNLKAGWRAITSLFGSYAILPAKEFDTSWVEASAFQPGMKAVCRECARYHYLESELSYSKWQVNDVLLWACPRGDIVADADMQIQKDLPGMAGTLDEDSADIDDEDDIEDGVDEADTEDDEAPDTSTILDLMANFSELIGLISDYPEDVRAALQPAALNAYASIPYNDPIIPDAVEFVKIKLHALTGNGDSNEAEA